MIRLGAILALVAGLLSGAPVAHGEEVCAPAPTVNDLCPEWTAVFDNAATGPVISMDSASAMAVSPGGSRVFVAGETRADDTGGDMTTIAYDSSGTRLWTARYHQPAEGTEVASDLVVSPDGGTVFTVGAEDVVAGGDSRATVAAYDAATGQQRWVFTHDGEAPGNDGARAAVISADGGTLYVAIASRGPGGDADVLTVALDAVGGQPTWSHRYAGAAGTDDEPSGLVLSSQGSRLFVTGTEGGTAPSSAYLTLAYDFAGEEPPTEPVWTTRYSGPGEGSHTPTAMGVAGDGRTVYVTGTSDGGATQQDWATVAYDAGSGAELWSMREASVGQDRATGLAVAGNRVVVTGKTVGDAVNVQGVLVREPQAVTVGYDAPTGTRLWDHTRSNPGRFGEESLGIVASADGSRVYVTDQAGVFTVGSQGGCSSGESFVCSYGADPGEVVLTSIATEDGRQEWTARAPGTGNLYRYSVVPVVAAAGSRVYMAATYAYPFAISNTGVQQAGNFTDLWTMAYQIPEDRPNNVTCGIEPSTGPSQGIGFGTPQIRADAVRVKASDNGSFNIDCRTGQGPKFLATARYHFEFSPSTGAWQKIGPGFACSVTSVGRDIGENEVAAMFVPGTPHCADAEIIFPEDDASLGLPHRLCVTVLEAAGCTAPWTHQKIGERKHP